ncbi:MAG: DUF4056 domain-containing protein [Phycisphaerales bacterium JB040]
MRRRLTLLAMGGLAGLSACRGAITSGCDGGELAGADFGDFGRSPSPRIGSIPFPSVVSLYEVADPSDLGRHVYRDGSAFEGGGERARGIVYTERAGFLDLAHVRNTVDHAAHVHARLRHALRSGDGCVRYRLAEPSVYTVEIDYPPSWWELGEAERLGLADDVAVLASEVLASHSMTWHEVLTWFGYRSVVLVSERPSAFTYDDPASHAVGAIVAGRALRESAPVSPGEAGPFEGAVTRWLAAVLRELGAESPAGTRAAVEAVRGEWWEGRSVLRRMVSGERVVPWLLARDVGAGVEPAEFRTGRLSGLSGHGACPSLRARVEPRVREGGVILRALEEARGPGDVPGSVDLEEDLPALLAYVRAEVVREFGPGSLAP